MDAHASLPETMIRGTGVGQRFGGRTLYRNVDFTVAKGEIFVILGGSGCGKSTLMRQIVGLLPPTEGHIELMGHDVYDRRTRKPGELRAQIGVMFQSGALFGSMNLLENVMLPMEMHTDLPPDARANLAQMKLGLVGLADSAGLMPAEISGGMAKRAAIARALALDPPLLFLDEPSAGLDQLILDLRSSLDATFVVVTHELSSILAIADRCVMLDKTAQGLIAEGDPRKLRDESTQPTVRAFFRREVLPAEATS